MDESTVGSCCAIRTGYVHSVGVIGGAEGISLSLLSAAQEADRSRRAVIAPAGELLDAASGLGAQTYPVKMLDLGRGRPVRTAATFLRLARALKQSRIELLHTGDILAWRAVAPPARWLGIPVICHIHFPYEASFFEWVFSGREGPATFLFCSEDLRRELEPVLAPLCPGCPMAVIHNGVDTEHFAPGPEVLWKETAQVGIVANLQERKGHVEFLHMARRLQDAGHAAQFHIYGGDILGAPRLPMLKALAAELGITEAVAFHGQVSDVRAALHGLDVVVCPSYQEAFPLSVLEAMACARPVVASRVNGIPEAITDRETGLLVPPRDAEALAGAVASLLEDRAAARTLARRAADHVRDQFSLGRFGACIESLYSEVLG